MPVVASFFGVTITMYYRDHPPPHFHADSGGETALVAVDGGEILTGRLHRTARRIVREWALANQGPLMDNWVRARRREPLESIGGPQDDA